MSDSIVEAERLRVGLYARCSTHDQDTGVQLRELRLHAEKRGWEVIEEYIDNGISGVKDARPALSRLMDDARSGKFQAVAVWKFDRAARSLRTLILMLDELRTLNVGFISVTEALDTSSALGRAMFGMIGVFAEFEREMLRSRVRAGVAKARASGKRVGRPKRWTTAQAEKAAQLRAEGASWRTVSQHVGLPVRTVRRALTVAKTQAA